MLRLITIALLVAVALAAEGAGTPGAGKAEELPPGASPEQTADARYREGLASKEAAWALEAEAAAATDAETREGLLADARDAWRQAVSAQGRALKLMPQHHEAANELGYALRNTGAYRKALGAYNYALGLKPDFYEAVEYRGEAYLALGMLDEAREAYMTLFRKAPELAGMLLAAMAAWARAHDDAAFSAWVEERRSLAELTGIQSDRQGRSAWDDRPSE